MGHRCASDRGCGLAARVVVGASLLACGWLQAAEPTGAASNFGPYNAVFLAGGVGLSRPLAPDAAVVRPGAAWSISGWVRADRTSAATMIVAALGEPEHATCRCVLIAGGHLGLSIGGVDLIAGGATLEPGTWHSMVAAYDGAVAILYVDGVEQERRAVTTRAVAPILRLAPEDAADPAGDRHFGGALARFSLADYAPPTEQVAQLHVSDPGIALIQFHHVGVGWPWQQHAWRGLQEPQPAWTLPRSNAPFSAPSAAMTAPTPALTHRADGAWVLGAWHLAAAPTIADPPERLSQPDYGEQHWYPAVVPGTVLTTLIANGVYPDPDIGLNNLAIPESLSRQDYWYRTRFRAPAVGADRRLTLTFKGINYAAEVWVNGVHAGAIRGAFIRGSFDVTAMIHPAADNAIAVRVSPPPHPGIPHEQSMAAGPGENGGNLAIDGPTFIATEGWDWIPAIRDRNTGIWQDVELSASGALRLLDPQVVTTLPLPRIDSADVIIRVPVENRGAAPVKATIVGTLEGLLVRKEAMLPPGVTEVVFDPSEFKTLRLSHPRLWWPNGYGAPELYTLALSVGVDGSTSDTRSVRFGVRELSYELSLFDRAGVLRRVAVSPASGAVRGERLVDVRHEAIKSTAAGWAESLTAAGEDSPAVRDADSKSLTPYLALRVNGVRIAARGGSWGMDDSRKRVARSRLEPYFRLHQEAHLNIIRNWLGQNTEEAFYDLADEYGLLVLNDFWASTQDFQVEPQDPALFLANARDVIRRYRNHPSIAVWFGRNEGVPQPILNEGLDELVATEDGTRYYTGSSNSINLQGSGPYNWRAPQQYFLDLARGFSVEVGTPSFASLESVRATIPAADRWPLGDSYAYHDWHFGGNGDTASFMQALERGLGSAASLEDFERKAQLMNYVSYRAIFEGFQAHLWTRNSGRLLWMTHPAWPSNAWQIYSSDYDTAAAYFAVAKACEPLHAQLNLPDFRLAVVNTGREPSASLRLTSRVLALDGRLLSRRIDHLSAAENAVTTLAPLELDPALAAEGLVLVVLSLADARGREISRNVYWQSRSEPDQRRLSELAPQPVAVRARRHVEGTEEIIAVDLTNHGRSAALLTKLTVLDAAGERVLPAFYNDNYLSLLPGEARSVRIRCPSSGRKCEQVGLRGWNVVPVTVGIVAPAGKSPVPSGWSTQ